MPLWAQSTLSPVLREILSASAPNHVLCEGSQRGPPGRPPPPHLTEHAAPVLWGNAFLNPTCREVRSESHGVRLRTTGQTTVEVQGTLAETIPWASPPPGEGWGACPRQGAAAPPLCLVPGKTPTPVFAEGVKVAPGQRAFTT